MRAMCPGGLMLSVDVLLNEAWSDFCEEKALNSIGRINSLRWLESADSERF